MHIALLAALLQVSNPPPSVDTSAFALAVNMPTASTTPPPCIGDTSSAGTAGTPLYAPYNHTHCSRVQRGRSLVPAAGTLDITFSPAYVSQPVCNVTAEATKGDTNVVNAQFDGTPSLTGATIRINRTAITVASLLGLNILSVPTQIATYADWSCSSS